MYIIDSGEFEVLKRDDNGLNQSVFTYTTDGAAFGELSLMYGKPRAATVRAKSDGALWSIGRLAFRAVLMKKRTSNLLKALRGLPVLKGLSVTKLHRIAECCTEETFNSNELVATSSSLSTSTDQWILLVVLEGSLRVTMKDGNTKTRLRGEGSTVGAIELQQIIETVSCETNFKTKIARIPESIFLEIMGDARHEEILKMTKVSRAARQSSIFSTPDMLKLSQGLSLSDYSLIGYLLTIGDYATVGNYQLKNDIQSTCSIKVIAKQRATSNKMDTSLLNERQYLAALQGSSDFLPRVHATYQNSKIVSLIYDETYDCDLAHLISINALTSDEKRLYTASLYHALQTLHENGLLHRFFNPLAIYISKKRKLPVVTDLRYAKKMDGYKSFTICGDPLYFAPEMVGQAGYDYSADLWALGVTVYEIYEVCFPLALSLSLLPL
jgi:serine/threonine protein kinase